MKNLKTVVMAGLLLLSFSCERNNAFQMDNNKNVAHINLV